MCHPFPFLNVVPLLRGENSVLLESVRCDAENRTSYFFEEPIELLQCWSPAEVPAFIDRMERYLAQGYYLAGYLEYEFGYQFEEIASCSASEYPIAHMGVYQRPLVYDHVENRWNEALPGHEDHAPEAGGATIHNLSLEIDESRYAGDVARIKRFLHAGETYQINYTTRYTFSYDGDPVALYAELRRKQPVPYGAFIRAGGLTIASFSPELFFRVQDGIITTKPMKGTARRGRTVEEDAHVGELMRTDAKSRAENLMIVDLLRNDLGRICIPGSVRVVRLFEPERYRTLHQMTSTIEGRLRQGVQTKDILRALFPCGSVTGAPKIRSMQIIHEIERRRRGVYTGAIGFFAPDGSAAFSVAIRTIELRGTAGSMGVGSGIVADSDTSQEFDECVLKGKFLTDQCEHVELLETLLWTNGYPFLEQHLQRLGSSAEYFEYPVDTNDVRQKLLSLARQFTGGERYRVRLRVDANGRPSVSFSTLSADRQAGHDRLALSSRHTHSDDVFLYHKTTRRRMYDEELSAARANGYGEVVFLNERGEITEGAISNIIIERGGRLFTPPVSAGLLNGVYRRHLLEHTTNISEKTIFPADLLSADALYCCNAVRGMWKVVPAFSS